MFTVACASNQSKSKLKPIAKSKPNPIELDNRHSILHTSYMEIQTYLNPQLARLPRPLAKKAEKELNEHESTRLAAIEQLRQQVQEIPNLNACLDDVCLLRYLRVAKFNQANALKRIISYYTLQADYPTLCSLVPPSVMIERYRGWLDQPNLCMPCHPVRQNKTGCGIIIVKASNWNPKKYSADDVMLLFYRLVEWLLLNNETQVNGLCIIINCEGFGFSHLTSLRPYHIPVLVRVLTNSMPVRIKGLHQVNQSKAFDILIGLVKPFLNDKLKKRIFLHGKNLNQLHEHFEPKILPAELGGSFPKYDHEKFLDLFMLCEEHSVRHLQYGFNKQNIGN